MSDKKLDFRVETDKRTGKLRAGYLKFRRGKAARTDPFTTESGETTAYADFDEQGRLLGVEFLAACRVVVPEQLPPEEGHDG